RQRLLLAGDALVIAGVVGVVLVVAALLFWVAPAFDRWFQRFTKFYERSLLWALRHRAIVLAAVTALLGPSYFAFRATGQELFPDVDSSEFTLHMRASGGPRVEETERQIGEIENMIRGYQATAAQFSQEVSAAVVLNEAEHLEAIRAANPEHA